MITSSDTFITVCIVPDRYLRYSPCIENKHSQLGHLVEHTLFIYTNNNFYAKKVCVKNVQKQKCQDLLKTEIDYQ